MDPEKNMKERQGKCKYCGQYKVIKCPESFSPEAVDEEVTNFCDCEMARRESEIKSLIACTETQIKGFFQDKDMETFEKTFLALTEPMARKELEKISIKAGKYTITMKRKPSSIEISLKETTEEKVES